MTLDDQTEAGNNLVYYTDGFRNILEDHLTYFINHPQTTAQQVDPQMAYRYEGDYWGLLNYYNISYEMHYLIMRMNGLTMPSESGRDITLILKPPLSVVTSLLSNYQSQTA